MGAQAVPGAHLIGRVLDERFALKSVLGVGGMGTVYRAEQFSMHRDVAVKVLRADNATDDLAVRRFLTEARAASRLKSPHTVTVFDFGRTADGILYIAMELMEGRTLARVLVDEGKPFGLVRVTRLMNQVLDSIEEAHGVGILHRDLKPDNVFLLEGAGSRDFLKVLDFGVAKMVGDPRSGTTIAGVSFGTPLYMSPEQMMGREVGPTADLYAVAIMLFELLAGQAPMEGLSPVELAVRKVEGRLPAPREVNPSAESVDELDRFLARAMSPDPKDRPEDVEAFREELNRAVRNATTGPRPEPWGHGPTPAATGPGMPPGMDAPQPQPPAPPPPLPAAGREERGHESAPTRLGIPFAELAAPPTAPPRDPLEDDIFAGAPEPRPTFGPDPVAHGPPAPRIVLPHRPLPIHRADADRRAQPRVPHLSSVVCVAEGSHHRGLVSDVSETGAFVHSQWLPRPGQEVTVLFRPLRDDYGPALVLASEVVRTVATPRAPGEVRGFSVRWHVLRTQGRLGRLLSFYRDLFGSELPGAYSPDLEARLWEFRFDDHHLAGDGEAPPATDSPFPRP